MFSSSQYFDLQEAKITLLKLFSAIFGSEEAGRTILLSCVTCLCFYWLASTRVQ